MIPAFSAVTHPLDPAAKVALMLLSLRDQFLQEIQMMKFGKYAAAFAMGILVAALSG